MAALLKKVMAVKGNEAKSPASLETAVTIASVDKNPANKTLHSNRLLSSSLCSSNAIRRGVSARKRSSVCEFSHFGKPSPSPCPPAMAATEEHAFE
jgi:hypothetical protein